jgi:hypothetical protein
VCVPYRQRACRPWTVWVRTALCCVRVCAAMRACRSRGISSSGPFASTPSGSGGEGGGTGVGGGAGSGGGARAPLPMSPLSPISQASPQLPELPSEYVDGSGFSPRAGNQGNNGAYG